MRRPFQPVFAVALWADLGRLTPEEFVRVRDAMDSVMRDAPAPGPGVRDEPTFTLEYEVEPGGMVTFARLVWKPSARR